MSDDLWMIEAMIQPFKLESVTLALAQVPGFGGMTVSDCRGFGRGKLAADAKAPEESTAGELRRGLTDAGPIDDFTSKSRIEVVVDTSEAAADVVDAIAKTAHTGRPGDGMIFVWPISRAIRVRTFQDDRSGF